MKDRERVLLPLSAVVQEDLQVVLVQREREEGD
jgi:hypothetical protein